MYLRKLKIIKTVLRNKEADLFYVKVHVKKL